VIPVLIDSRYIASWVQGTDLLMIFTPIITGWFWLALYTYPSLFPLLRTNASRPMTTFSWILFVSGLIIYIEGCMIHLMANLMKRPIEDAEALVNNTTSTGVASVISHGYSHAVYWEHVIGHYIFFIGGILMIISILKIRSQTHAFFPLCCSDYSRTRSSSIDASSTPSPSPPSDTVQVIAVFFFILSIFLFALLVASIFIEFPKGLIVGFVLLPIIIFFMSFKIFFFFKKVTFSYFLAFLLLVFYCKFCYFNSLCRN